MNIYIHSRDRYNAHHVTAKLMSQSDVTGLLSEIGRCVVVGVSHVAGNVATRALEQLPSELLQTETSREVQQRWIFLRT